MPVLVEIAKPFTLLLDDQNTYKKFFPGPQYVDDNEAKHWYVKLHLVGALGVEAGPAPGSQAHADMLKKQHEATARQFQMEAEAKGLLVAETQRKQHEEAVTQITAQTKVEAKRASSRVVLKARRDAKSSSGG